LQDTATTDRPPSLVIPITQTGSRPHTR